MPRPSIEVQLPTTELANLALRHTVARNTAARNTAVVVTVRKTSKRIGRQLNSIPHRGIKWLSVAD